jgi:prepilin-type N-terminal cleavage/methylation domain-containing protein
MTLKRKQEGFTIVELLIVIVVIGILAALVITTFTGIQQKARDTERQADVKALQGQVEAYYAQKGYYPARTNVNTATWRATNMKGLDAEALKDPKNSAATGSLEATTDATTYRYDVLTTADETCEDDETTCAKYTLEATLEAGSTYSKTNLN